MTLGKGIAIGLIWVTVGATAVTNGEIVIFVSLIASVTTIVIALVRN